MIVSWFSCGAASALATAIALDEFPETVVARCIVDNEHEDNERFHDDCEKWFGKEILRLRSDDYADCWEVWEHRQYISGIKGAPCTSEMKKAVRWAFEREHHPEGQVFGYTSEEVARAERFRQNNPEVFLLTPLIDNSLNKFDCLYCLECRGIEIPTMYKLGFSNNNCIGCAKATSIVYWARTRHHFPDKFARMSELSRRLGCRLTRLKGKRIFIDEIPLDIDWRKKDRENIECGLLCVA